MSDTGTPDDGPSLEMPSFSLRRTTTSPAEDEAIQPDASAPQPPERRELPTLALTGLPAATVAGLVVGGLTLLVAWLAAAGCDAVRGTSACGGTAGLPILVVGLVLLAWVGALLLRACGVAESGATSILGVGVLAVLVMLFLLGSVDEWWTGIALPLLAAASYAGAWWVTTSVADDDAAVESPEPYDVR